MCCMHIVVIRNYSRTEDCLQPLREGRFAIKRQTRQDDGVRFYLLENIAKPGMWQQPGLGTELAGAEAVGAVACRG